MALLGMPASLPWRCAAWGVERVVLAGDPEIAQPRICRSPPRTLAPSSASMTMPPRSLRQAAQYEVGAARGAVGEQTAAVAAKLQALDHVTRHRMIDAGDGEAVEGNVAEERFELAMEILERLEVVEVLGIDVGDADIPISRPQAHEGAVALVGLDDHPLALAETGVGAPVLDDAAGNDRRIDTGSGQNMGD